MNNRAVALVSSGLLFLVFACGAKNDENLTFDGRPRMRNFCSTMRSSQRSLPKPGATRSASNDQRIYDHPAGARLHLPAGFRISVLAEGGFR